MTRNRPRILLWGLLTTSAWAQSPLTLNEAVERAVSKHPSIAATKSSIDVADARLRQAQSGRLPKVNYNESWQLSNNPVFVFSSLLTQRQFAASNFAIGALNNPSALNNFQSVVSAEQPLYDAGQTKHATAGAQLGREVAVEDQRKTEQQAIGRVAAAYYAALLAADMRQVAEAAVRSSESDLERAVNVRTAGLSTDADVLSIRVHLAAMQEQQIRRRADLSVAEAALNEAMGEPLDTHFTLTTPLTVPSSTPTTASTIDRPEVRQAKLAGLIAENQATTARAAYLPQVSLRAAVEADRQRFVTRAGGNWFAGVTLRWNLFNGFADRARIEEATYAVTRAHALEQQATQGVALEVRRAQADLDAARQRITVAESSVTQAEESLRITKNRYEAGLTTVTELLRSETAFAEAQSRRVAAVHDQRLAGVALEFATGTLNPNSEVLK
ncbi:MAG: TolC family protein [Bryobacteraceae bacterium]